MGAFVDLVSFTDTDLTMLLIFSGQKHMTLVIFSKKRQQSGGEGNLTNVEDIPTTTCVEM